MGNGDNGGKLGAVRDALADAVVNARDRLRHDDHEHVQRHLTSWLDRMEDEISPHVAAVLGDVIDDPAVSEPTRDLLRKLSGPEHATAITLLLAAAGAVVYPLISAAITPQVQAIQQARMRDDPNSQLTVAEIALGMVRDTLGGIDPYSEALRSGVDAHRLEVLERNTGEPISLQELLLLYRRGQIDAARLEHGVRQSRIRNEWLDAVLDLRFAPPPAGEVVTGLLKGHLSEADAARKLGEAGIDPTNLEWLRASAGRPYGIEQALELWNRGEITEARVRQVIAQSDVNTDFADDLLKLRVYLPPPRSVVPMLRSGSITEDQARVLLSHYGVPAQYVDAFIGEAKTARKQTTRDLTLSQIVRLYESKLITHADAHDRLSALGYQPDEVADILDLADEAQRERILNAAVSRVHSRYVTHKMNRVDASSALDSFGVTPAARDQWLTMWGHERAANVSVLTLAQTQGALRREIISVEDFVTRCRALGYEDDDIPILAIEAFPPTKVPAVLFDFFSIPREPLPGTPPPLIP